MTRTIPTPTPAAAPAASGPLAQAGEIPQDNQARLRADEDPDCECDDCDCPICVPGCC